MIKAIFPALAFFLILGNTGCRNASPNYRGTAIGNDIDQTSSQYRNSNQLSHFQQTILINLGQQVNSKIWYEDGYYTGGDPPAHIGVCTDVVIRSYRSAGVNLQNMLAKDIRQSPSRYHITRPDRNIDHRRCRNLAVYFKYYSIHGRHWKQLPIEGSNTDWQPGDIVIWSTGNNGYADHIGVVANHIGTDGYPTVVHHWPGNYVKEDDCLYRFPALYHFRYV